MHINVRYFGVFALGRDGLSVPRFSEGMKSGANSLARKIDSAILCRKEIWLLRAKGKPVAIGVFATTSNRGWNIGKDRLRLILPSRKIKKLFLVRTIIIDWKHKFFIENGVF